MNKTCRAAALLLALVLLLTGCSRRETALNDNELLRVGDVTCTKAEAMLYILSQHSIYAGAYGESIWSVKLSEGSFEQYVLDALLDYLEMLFLVDRAAVSAGVRLSEAETAQVERAADAFMAELDEHTRSVTGITGETVLNAYARYARVQIYHRQVLAGRVDELSDEEARAIRLQFVVLDRSGGMEQAQAVLEKLKNGTAVSDALKGIEGAETRKETVVRGKYTDTFDTLAFALKKDQWSNIITMYGSYYMVQCLSTFEAEATAVNKASIESERREKLLKDALEEYGKSVTMMTNPELWSTIRMSSLEGLSKANFYDHTAALNAAY